MSSRVNQSWVDLLLDTYDLLTFYVRQGTTEVTMADVRKAMVPVRHKDMSDREWAQFKVRLGRAIRTLEQTHRVTKRMEIRDKNQHTIITILPPQDPHNETDPRSDI